MVTPITTGVHNYSVKSQLMLISVKENYNKFNSLFFAIVLGLLSFPAKPTILRVFFWITILPIHIVFLFTIPDCNLKRFRKWFPLTFIMCIIWIGSLSYVVAWMITIVGK